MTDEKNNKKTIHNKTQQI